jgi:hypothetical protein
MIGFPAARPELQTAPPTKRANSDGIPVRTYDGFLVAQIQPELADILIDFGAASAFRQGQRRYLRLRQGITIPVTVGGWDVIEFLRNWHGDNRAAAYVAHKDRQSERLPYGPRPVHSIGKE